MKAMIDHTPLRKSIARLEAQLQNWRTLDAGLPALLQEAVAESVIRRFNVCHDCLWKVLKRHLAEELGVPNLPNSPKPILRIAHENHLLDDIDAWLDYADARTDVAHDHAGEKAQAALKRIPSFVADARALYCTMSGEAWTLENLEIKDGADIDSSRVTLDLDAWTIETARILGKGDLSLGIRQAVELALEKLEEPTVPLRAAVKALTIKTLVPMIMEREACGADQALKRFNESHIGSCFADDETGLYGESALHVFSLYVEEQEALPG